jgi:F-type H+-transporting ATPase subunit c
MITPYTLRYCAIFFAIGFGALGVGLGQGLASRGILRGLGRQQLGSDQSFRALVLGLAFTETGMILAFVMALLLFFADAPASLGSAFAEMGCGLAIGLSSASVGFASSMAVSASCYSISRQPFFSQKIFSFMLLMQTLVEAPVIFAFIIGLLIKVSAAQPLSMYEGMKFFSAGLVIALGSIGPALGQAQFVQEVLRLVGVSKEAYSKLFTFSLLSQAFIETPVIFSVVLAFIHIYKPLSADFIFMSALCSVISSCVLGIGTIGTGRAIGSVAAAAARAMVSNLEASATLFRTSVLANAFIESSVIYCLIVALLIATRF